VYAKKQPCEDRLSPSLTSQLKRQRRRNATPPKTSRRPLGAALPHSPTGQHLIELFPNGWDWIYAETPSRGNQPTWETIKRYPLTPIELWSHHQAPDGLIGIRPSAATRWGILDIDRHSPYHPQQNPAALQTIYTALEQIGITRTLLNQSSHNGGLHLYIPLPSAVSSYWLSITLKYHLEAAGIKLRSGQCELFPNPKRYVPQGQGYSLFNAIRLPMQPDSGFYPLDANLTPLPWSLEDWLAAFEQLAQGQDFEQLQAAIADAKQNHKIRRHRDPHSLATWQERIEQEQAQGWTGPGQTNEKLKAFACQARVFMGMDSEAQIAQHIRTTAEQTPGFYQHSQHTHDLAQRSQDIARWAIRYYWPYGSPAQRSTGYHEQPAPVANFGYHQAKQEAAQHRIREAIAQLQAAGTLPTTASDRAIALVSLANTSKKTLYRTVNKPLWHPDYVSSSVPLEIAESPSVPASLQPEPKSAQNPPQRSLKSAPAKESLQLYKYVGFVVITLLTQAGAALTDQGQKAALPSSQTLDQGGSRGEAAPPAAINNWAMLKASLPPGLQTKINQVAPAESSGFSPAAPTPLPSPDPQSSIQTWQSLRASLPEPLQQKIAQAEQAQHHQQKLEQQRRLKAQFRQQHQQLNLLSLNPDSELTQLASSLPFSPQSLSTQPALASPQSPSSDLIEPPSNLVFSSAPREPSAGERDEFNHWYDLAQRFKLVSDYRWQDQDYWVFSQEQWHSYCDLSSSFTLAYLQRSLTPDSTSIAPP
jgi:hypothetical protein